MQLESQIEEHKIWQVKEKKSVQMEQTLSAKGSRLKGGSCSKYSKISAPAELEYSPSSLDEPLKVLFLIESPFKPCKLDSTRCCCVHTAEQLALLSVSQSLLPALLVSLDDSSLSSPGLL